MAAETEQVAPTAAAMFITPKQDELKELQNQLYGDVGSEGSADIAGGDDDNEDEAGDSAAGEDLVSLNADNKPLSKNQAKKLKRMEARNAAKLQRKAIEKAEKAAKRALVLAERAKRPPPSEESERLRAEAKIYRDKVKAEHRARVMAGPKIVIDCDYGPQMSDKDLKHLCQQLGYSYSAATRNHNGPCHLHLLGLSGRVKEMADKQISGVNNWTATVSERSHLDHFTTPEERSRLVYLTADSEVELDTIDPEKVYIIGGLVDHNSHKGICAKRAAEQGLATARLPIQKYVQLETSCVLTVNQVVSILAEYVARKDWGAVLDDVLPRRKRSDFAAEAKQRAQAKDVRREQRKQGSHHAAMPDKVAPTDAAVAPMAVADAPGVIVLSASNDLDDDTPGTSERAAALVESAATTRVSVEEAPPPANAAGPEAAAVALPAGAVATTSPPCDAAAGLKRKAEGPPE